MEKGFLAKLKLSGVKRDLDEGDEPDEAGNAWKKRLSTLRKAEDEELREAFGR